MTETIKLPNYYEPDRENARYGSLEELKELLLYKRIVKWDKDSLLLEDAQRSLLKCLKVIAVPQRVGSSKMYRLTL